MKKQYILWFRYERITTRSGQIKGRSMEVWLIAIVFILAIYLLGKWVIGSWRKAQKYNELKPRLDNLDAYKTELESKESEFKNRQVEWEKKVHSDIETINTLAKEKSQGFPWLAQAYSDFFHLQDLKRTEYLEHKSHPARKAAEDMREIASKRKIAEKLYRILKYQLDYYENLFPWLIEFKSEGIGDLISQILDKRTNDEEYLEEPDDPAKKWLTAAEYEKLPKVEKYQIALDRYWQKRKTKWELGRDYERYIGYLYESKGYKDIMFIIKE